MADHDPPTAAQPVLLRSVALPTEHGGWSLTLEPAVLGLIVAPSAAGWLLGLAALVAFVARTPLKLALVDRRRDRRLPRTVLASQVALVELAGLAGLLTAAWLAADQSFWPPLLMAAPLMAVQLWYDVRSRSRRLAPELAGTVGIGAVAAAVALAGGEAAEVAAGLWCVAAARSVAAIPFVRVQLRRAKEQDHRIAESDAAQILAVAAVAAGALLGAVPPAGAAAVAGLAGFHTWAARRRPPSTPVLGAQQTVLGLVVVLVTGLAAAAP